MYNYDFKAAGNLQLTDRNGRKYTSPMSKDNMAGWLFLSLMNLGDIDYFSYLINKLPAS
jgi:hypothetical protein